MEKEHRHMPVITDHHPPIHDIRRATDLIGQSNTEDKKNHLQVVLTLNFSCSASMSSFTR